MKTSNSQGGVGKASGANNFSGSWEGLRRCDPGGVFSAVGAYSSSAAFVDGFAPAIARAAGISLLGALAALDLPARRASSARH